MQTAHDARNITPYVHSLNCACMLHFCERAGAFKDNQKAHYRGRPICHKWLLPTKLWSHFPHDSAEIVLYLSPVSSGFAVVKSANSSSSSTLEFTLEPGIAGVTHSQICTNRGRGEVGGGSLAHMAEGCSHSHGVFTHHWGQWSLSDGSL